MWKKFNLNILVFTPFIVLLIGGFSWLVDPYDIFDSPKIDGLNKNKPEVDSHTRIQKAIKLQQLKPQTVFIGTSRTNQGINPANQNIKKPAYNSAMNAGLPVEYEYYVDTAIKNEAKEIIIGVDLFTFYAKALTNASFDKDALTDFNKAKYIFSVSTLNSAMLSAFSQKPSAYLQNGMRDPMGLQQDCENNGGHKKMFSNSAKSYYDGAYAKDMNKLQVSHWQAFERILDKAYKNSLKITLFISPSHARQWEVLAITQGWEMFEEYRRRLVVANEKIAHQNGKEPFVLWDFAGYHPLTTESVPDNPKAKMKYYWDSSHYKKELGNIVLDRMFDGNFSGGQNYPDFGARLTSQNIESHLAKLRADRAKWRAAHPADIAEIEALRDERQK